MKLKLEVQEALDISDAEDTSATLFELKEEFVEKKELVEKDLGPISQKAQSLEAIKERLPAYHSDQEMNYKYSSLVHTRWPINPDTLDTFDLPEWVLKTMKRGKLFVRPCPPSPQPGFVDSRVVKTVADLKALCSEVYGREKNGEVILTVEIQNPYASCIVTPTSLSVGAGNDGATDGKDALQLAWNGWNGKAFKHLRTDSAIDDDKDPHVEVVARRSPVKHSDMYNDQMMSHHLDVSVKSQPTVFVVQCRAGDRVPGACKDDVRTSIKEIKHVIVPTGEETFTEWRDILTNALPDTVVCQMGGSVTSHWGMNCRDFNIPYVTSKILKVGDSCLEKDFGAAPYEHQPYHVIHGIGYALRTMGSNSFVSSRYNTRPDVTTHTEALSLVLFGLHNYILQEPSYGSRLLGLSIGYLIRLLGTACIGEYRHAPSLKTKKSKPSRMSVYEKVWYDWHTNQKSMANVYRSFRDDDWDSSFGGPAWQRAARHQMIMYSLSNEIARRLIGHRDPTFAANRTTSKMISDLSMLLNEAVNLAHNTGWVLNKYAKKRIFDVNASGELEAALQVSTALESHRTFLKYGVHGGEVRDPSNISIRTAFDSLAVMAKTRPGKSKVYPVWLDSEQDAVGIDQKSNVGYLADDKIEMYSLVDKSLITESTDLAEVIQNDCDWEIAMQSGLKAKAKNVYKAMLPWLTEHSMEWWLSSDGLYKKGWSPSKTYEYVKPIIATDSSGALKKSTFLLLMTYRPSKKAGVGSLHFQWVYPQSGMALTYYDFTNYSKADLWVTTNPNLITGRHGTKKDPSLEHAWYIPESETILRSMIDSDGVYSNVEIENDYFSNCFAGSMANSSTRYVAIQLSRLFMEENMGQPASWKIGDASTLTFRFSNLTKPVVVPTTIGDKTHHHLTWEPLKTPLIHIPTQFFTHSASNLLNDLNTWVKNHG